MFSFGPESRVRAFGYRFFHRFGLHCATHQIRVILISSVFITSLLYPALAIYSSSQPQFLARISTHLLNSFLATEVVASYSAYHDLRDVWFDYEPFLVRNDSATRARCGTKGILRVERVLIRNALPEDADTLNNQILLSTLNLERKIGKTLTSRRVQCLSKQDRTCFVISPIAFWDYDEQRLLSDMNIFNTLQSSSISISGIPIAPQMVLAGRQSSGTANGSFDFVTFLALTYFFPETDCIGNAGHYAWLHVLEQAVNTTGYLNAGNNAARLIALERKGTSRTDFSALTMFSTLAYLSLIAYGFQLSRRTDKVHSKIGIVFTGMVEVVASTITSVSVCALAGFRITMIPWEIFPIVVLFVGMENMFSLVDAIYKTPITLSVKERVAEGLSRAGTSNTLKLISTNTVLGVIATFSAGALRQFCAFAIVVLVAHWFLAHVFFTTVLSIDLQRLELDELLQQGTTVAPPVALDHSPQVEANTRWGRIVAYTHGLLQGRAYMNITLLLLLAITIVLYYSTQPSFIQGHDHTRGALSRSKPLSVASIEAQSPASQLWSLLNPNDEQLVHIRIETPSILIFQPNVPNDQPSLDPKSHHRSRLPTKTFKQLIWTLTIVVGPIFATTVVLYGLLLYLLKDAELLEAQHNRAERDAPWSPSVEPPVDDSVTFTTLPRMFSTDVELLAANKDGSVVVMIGMRNEFAIWRMCGDKQVHASVDISDVLQRSAHTSAASVLTALAVDDGGTCCAIGTGSGVIGLWKIDVNHVKPSHQLSLNDCPFAVGDLHFITSPSASSSHTKRNVSSSPTSLLATYANGAAVNWTLNGSGEPICIKPSRHSLSSRCAILSRASHNTVAFLAEDGTLEICSLSLNTSSGLEFCIAVGNPADPVSAVDACDIEIGGKQHTIVGTATKTGVVSVWDRETGDCITTIEDQYGEVNNLRLSAVKTRTCPFCGELPPDTFTIAFSVGQIMLVYRAYVFANCSTRKCSCPYNQPQQAPFRSVGVLAKRRLRNGSNPSSGTSSPMHLRSRHHPISGVNTSAQSTSTQFPVSGHGVHSRRATEKDTLRKAVESMVLPLPIFENEDYEKSLPSLDAPMNMFSTRSSLWENVIVARAADTTFERGKWDIINEKVVGLSRKPRSPLQHNSSSSLQKIQLKPESSSGLSPASLERWELWIFDPFLSKIQASSLIMLRPPDKTRPAENDVWGNSIPRLPFTRISPFICTDSHCFAGFGNTVGVFSIVAAPSVHPRISMDRGLRKHG